MKRSLRRSAVVWGFTLIVCFIILWPVYWIVKSSFTDATKLYQMPVRYLPINLTLDSYRTLFSYANIRQYFNDTLFIAFAVLLLSVILCALAGYAFARNNTKAINLVFVFLLFSTMIPGTVTVIPLIVMWRNLQLTDTFPGLIILYFSMVIPFSTLMFTGAVKQIPPSVEEAAMIDGTSLVGAFFRVVFPLLRPIMATLCILNFIACINEFFTPLMFTSKNLKLMSQLMANIPRANQYQLPWDTISAAGCLMLLPTIIFIVCFEKQILEGLMMGSIKQ